MTYLTYLSSPSVSSLPQAQEFHRRAATHLAPRVPGQPQRRPRRRGDLQLQEPKSLILYYIILYIYMCSVQICSIFFKSYTETAIYPAISSGKTLIH